MPDSEVAPNLWLNEILDALNRLGVALKLLGEFAGLLLRDSDRYEIYFHDALDNEGKNVERRFSGKTPRGGRSTWLSRNDNCRDLEMNFRLFPEQVRDLWQARADAESSLDLMPAAVAATIDELSGRPWRADVRLACLDRVLIWPNEKIHNLKARKVSTTPDDFLENVTFYDPRNDWTIMREKLVEWRAQLIAIRGEVLDKDLDDDDRPTSTSGNSASETVGDPDQLLDLTEWTRPMSKSEAARYLNCPVKKKAAWINQRVKDGTLKIKPLDRCHPVRRI